VPEKPKLALAVPFGWLAVVGPLTISILILKVSGVPMLEKLMSKNPDFADYKKHTSMFVPMPYKK
jgi:steroid 5-alpha reductase family enzyme